MKKLLIIVALLIMQPLFAQKWKKVMDNGNGIVVFCDSLSCKNVGFGVLNAVFMAQVRDTQIYCYPTQSMRQYNYSFFHDTLTYRVLSVSDRSGQGYRSGLGCDFYLIPSDTLAHFVMKQLGITH